MKRFTLMLMQAIVALWLHGLSTVALAQNAIGQTTLTAASYASSSTTSAAFPGVSSSSQNPVIMVAAGTTHTCAVVGGGLQCWGDNSSGQLGDNTTTSRKTPVTVIPAGSGVTEVAAGAFTDNVLPYTTNSHSCALVNGNLGCWGRNGYDPMGLAPYFYQSLAVDTTMSTGALHTCYVLNGGVNCWGNNETGQLGGGTATTTWFAAIPAGSGVTTVAAGAWHTCAVVNGGVDCWGNNDPGQLGGGTARTTWYTAAPAASGATAVSAGQGHACAVVNGGVQCWGDNGFGKLGIGDSSAGYTLIAGSGATAVAAGAMHTCALVNGGVQCWGENGFGQLGNGGSVAIRTPITTIPAGSAATAVTAGGTTDSYEGYSSHTCAVVNGRVQCWGYNGYGQLGIGTNANSRTPASVVTSVSSVGGTVPQAPTIGTATAGCYLAVLSFTPPANDGGSAITGYTVTSIPAGGVDANAASTALTDTITGLNNGTSYIFTVRATSLVGNSAESVASNGVIPTASSASFTVSASVSANGSVSPASQNVAQGNTASLTITPNTGYTAFVSGCSGNLSGNTYTTQMVTADCAVSATFALTRNLVNFVVGWNLLGNGVNAPLDVTTFLGDASKITSVWKWDPLARKWAFFAPSMTATNLASYAVGKGYDVLTTINGGEGFWVNAKIAFMEQLAVGSAIDTSDFGDQLPPLSNKLPPGWSLIAVGDNPTPRKFVNSIALALPVSPVVAATSLATLWAWDGALSSWYFYAPSLDNSGELANYLTSKNYKDFITNGKTLDATTGFWVNHP